ncbi:MAG: UDP-N-acetylmuramate--L-alanine ligase [Gemmatimonadetes bacterium]|nr:MAG: UDP-N-acetylmuramate--L-alanine ligase [Gemmatimonadota bacterium]
MFHRLKNIHMVGIGGAGMSGIAEILLNRGHNITGSDLNLTEVTARLEQLGATIMAGHDAANLQQADVVVISSAVPETNPEVVAAKERGIPVIKRSIMLAELMRMHYGICIAGTHGKTTTTSMVGCIVRDAGLDPTIIVGGRVGYLQSNAHAGKGEYLIVEADEFDRTFLELTPSIAVITTIESEHLDCYEDINDIKQAFLTFAAKVPFYGAVIACLDNPGVQEIIPQLQTRKRLITYGIENPQATFQAYPVDRASSTFEVRLEGTSLGKIHLKSPGDHNISNALAAVAVASELEIPFDQIKAALEGFSGVHRRFEIKGEIESITVADDYAHHPTEVKATLKAAQQSGYQRVVVVFQPHLYTRTRDFCDEFARSFYQADVLIVTDVYPSREKPIEGITGKLIADAAKTYGHKQVHYIADKVDVPAYLAKITRAGDLVLTMGAGDIVHFGERFLQQLSEKG